MYVMKFMRRMMLCLLFASWAFVVNAAPLAEGGIPVYMDSAASILVSTKNPQFHIIQAANPTTGYSWAQPVYDKELLQLVSSHYQAPNKQVMGASGYMVWTFGALPAAFTSATPDNTSIRLTYRRPWNPKDHPTTVIFQVEFKQPGEGQTRHAVVVGGS